MSKNKSAFTLIELMAAIGILALIIAFTSIIFSFGIDAHRVSVANAEIMQKARAITEQLNSDFRGLRKDAPLFIWFKQDDPLSLKPNEDPNRYDQIMFFASGDFSTLQMYEDVPNSEPLRSDDTITSDAKVIKGNLSRIHYTHATNADQEDIEDIKLINRNLSRRIHILYSNPKSPSGSDMVLEGWPDFNNFDWETEDYYEHDTKMMADWKYAEENNYKIEILPKMIVDYLPKIDKTDPDTLHLLFSENVSSYKIQFGYWGRDNSTDDWELRWFPSDNPDGDNSNTDSHFDIDPGILNEFGLYFNLSDVDDLTDIEWYSISDMKQEWNNVSENYKTENFPSALKFTFTVYDKHQVIEGGKTFTHVVYLDD